MRFYKEIITPGTYTVTTLDGSNYEDVVDVARIKRLVATYYEMRAAGILIPAPYDHYEEGKAIGPDDPLLSVFDSRSNAGWWERMWFDEERQALYGEVDIPLPEDASRIGKTIREVSPYINNYKSGRGVYWKEAIHHVALVTRPVRNNQEKLPTSDQPHAENTRHHNDFTAELSIERGSETGACPAGVGSGDCFRSSPQPRMPGNHAGQSCDLSKGTAFTTTLYLTRSHTNVQFM